MVVLFFNLFIHWFFFGFIVFVLCVCVCKKNRLIAMHSHTHIFWWFHNCQGSRMGFLNLFVFVHFFSLSFTHINIHPVFGFFGSCFSFCFQICYFYLFTIYYCSFWFASLSLPIFSLRFVCAFFLSLSCQEISEIMAENLGLEHEPQWMDWKWTTVDYDRLHISTYTESNTNWTHQPKFNIL